MSAAPIALIPGTGPGRAGPVLESLRRAEGAAESPLTIFCETQSGAEAAVLRRLAGSESGFRSVEIVELPEHGGRSRHITDSVSAILRDHERVIVVEDDILVSPAFLRFMNDALETYAGEERVACVSGSSFKVPVALRETFFLPGAHCWAWGTWRRAWAPARFDPAHLLREVLAADLIHALDAGGAEPLTQALQDAVFDGTASWSLCWMGVAILEQRLTLYPGRALAVNVHAPDPVAPVFATELSAEPVRVTAVPVAADKAVQRKVADALVQRRCLQSRTFRAYAWLAAALPPAVEQPLYSAVIRHKLGRNARRRGFSEPVPTGGPY